MKLLICCCFMDHTEYCTSYFSCLDVQVFLGTSQNINVSYYSILCQPQPFAEVSSKAIVMQRQCQKVQKHMGLHFSLVLLILNRQFGYFTTALSFVSNHTEQQLWKMALYESLYIAA